MSNNKIIQRALITLAAAAFSFSGGSAAANANYVSQTPLFVTQSAPPLNMLVMSRDHTLYYEAYNDASDLDGDGVIDVGYKPDQIDYYGYFNSHVCYEYTGGTGTATTQAASDGRFKPKSAATGANKKQCSNLWSGDFLNYLATSRMDALRRVLYGGHRAVDSTSNTILQAAYIPRDGHSWGKSYDPKRDAYSISHYAPLSTPSNNKRHLFAVTTMGVESSNRTQLRILKDTDWQIWDWVSRESTGGQGGEKCGSAGQKASNGKTGAHNCGTTTGYNVRVEACTGISEGLREDSCKAYPNPDGEKPIHKPTGLLHDFGENEQMFFGLLTGSFEENITGGTLRRNISSFADEVNPNTGVFRTNVDGIVANINRLKVIDFNSSNYYTNCNWDSPYKANPIDYAGGNSAHCAMWGNPVAEMMFETLRYFAGATSAHSLYDYGDGGSKDKTHNLTKPVWVPPYEDKNKSGGGYQYCARPAMTVLSDINPSYDYKLPGSRYQSIDAQATALSGFNVSNEVDAIGEAEGIHGKNYFIGQSTADNANDAPTPKKISSLSYARGLAPEEPSKRGTYYSAGVARYGAMNKIAGTNAGKNEIMTYAVALASPLPEIRLPVGNGHVTVVPFAKSVKSDTNPAIDLSYFVPTNPIVDYYVDTIANTGTANQNSSVNGGRPYAKFIINYEDMEVGSDHDMDAIAEYTVALKADGDVNVEVKATFKAGSTVQHMGYVISGTTEDGIYIEIEDTQNKKVFYELNTPPGQAPGYCVGKNNNTSCKELPSSTNRDFTPSASSTTGEFLKDPLWYAAKYGMPGRAPDSVDGDPANYFLVTNALGLKAQLSEAFNQILGEATSASSVATNSTRLDSGSVVYQARFNPENWSGQLLAYDLVTESEDPSKIGSIGPVLWDSGSQTLKPALATRKVVTLDKDTTPAVPKGVDFKWANLSDAQKAHLNKDSLGMADSLGEDRVAYLRGDDTKEVRNGGTFRDRVSRDGQTPYWLGDIVNSDPVFVGAGNYGYGRPYSSGEGSDSYAAFVTSKKNRTPMIYVGANDGMLHGFNATNGAEKLAYVPNNVIPDLVHLTDPDYRHQYYVDSPPWAGDAYIGGGWKTILVGATGAGGRAVFALDVTDPDGFSANDVMWEFTHPDLGTAMGQPSIARLENGKWVAIFGNGSYSDNGKATLFILDLADGELIKQIDLTNGSPANGLSTPVAVDIDGNLNADYIYAGDLQGNMWKIDVRGATEADWHVAFSGSPLFQAKDTTGAIQPITHRPLVGLHDQGGLMVYFGTGKYFEVNDNQPGGQVQTFYGIRDQGTAIDDRATLQSQEIIYEGSLHGYDVRAVTANPVVSTQNGWYLDLIYGENAQGERVVANPLLRNGRIIFTTIIPSQDACSFGGNSWLMEMNAMTGGRLHESVFDLNGDGEFDDLDFIELEDGTRIPVSGKKSNEGLIKTPGIISDGTKEYKYTSGSSGTIERTVESSGSGFGRQSWRQLR